MIHAWSGTGADRDAGAGRDAQVRSSGDRGGTRVLVVGSGPSQRSE